MHRSPVRIARPHNPTNTRRRVRLGSRLLAIALAVVPGNTTSPGSVNAESPPPAPTPVTIHGATTQQADRVEWALDRFATARLPLPTLHITFHDNGDACNGHPGYIRHHNDTSLIDLCMPTRHVILHELAHAWESVALTDETRNTVKAYWGLTNWNNHHVDWNQRAKEKAADTIALTLNDIPDQPSGSLLRYLCSYQLLTGTHHPTTAAPECAGTTPPPSRSTPP